MARAGAHATVSGRTIHSKCAVEARGGEVPGRMFVSLDRAWSVDRAFVIGYRFTDDSSDRWTARFNAFKADEERAIRAGIAIMQVAVQAAIPLPQEQVIVIGVPGSAERRLAAGKPVARLAAALAASTERHARPRLDREGAACSSAY